MVFSTSVSGRIKRTNRILAFLLAQLLLLSLCACGTRESAEWPDMVVDGETVIIGEPQVSTETEPGFVTMELPMPEGYRNFDELQSLGDQLFIHAETTDGGFAVLRYDTLTDAWQSWTLDTGEAKHPQIDALSVADGTVWVRLFEGYSMEEMSRRDFSRKLRYFLIVLNTQTGEQTCTHMDFWRSANDSDPYLTGLIALDAERALLTDDEAARLISRDAQVIGTLNASLADVSAHVWIGDTMYLSTSDGYCRLDPVTLQFGEPMGDLLWANVYNSQRGRFLVTKERRLLEYDPASGDITEILDWMNVALRYSSLWYAYKGLENSQGDLFYLAENRLTKVHADMIPVKKPLILGCFADASAYGYEWGETDYTCPEALLDAIMRFNQTDPEYRITLKPMVWHDDAERNKLMIELATVGGIDVLDTSLLPPGAVDRQLLVDLLPFIDADPDISREDFIPSLLAAMTERGGLYEYTDRFTILTLLGAEHLGISRDEWTANKAASVLEQEDFAPYMTQEKMILLFSWAASAEFMDRANGICSFDSPAFIGWLKLMKQIPIIQPEGGSFYSPGCRWLISNDLASDAGYGPRSIFHDESSVLGFPDSLGTGSYFMKLLPADGMGHNGQLQLSYGVLRTQGCNSSLGIMASCENKNGAWRFVKTFMLGENDPVLEEGIPVLKASFERALKNSVQHRQSNINDYESFNEKDEAVMRKLVYSTNRMVIRDDLVIDTLKTEIAAYLAGKASAEKTARLIQSKMSLYMGEHYG